MDTQKREAEGRNLGLVLLSEEHQEAVRGAASRAPGRCAGDEGSSLQQAQAARLEGHHFQESFVKRVTVVRSEWSECGWNGRPSGTPALTNDCQG